MLKQRMEAANAVREDFLDAKAKVAAAHEAIARLCATAAVQRREAGLQLATGIEVQALFADALIGSARAYKSVCQSHPLLRDLITDVGIRRMFGGDNTMPESSPKGSLVEPELIDA